MPKPKKSRPKHVPIRTCIACRQEHGKRELVRIVRTLNAGVKVDPTGKVAGRGAYLCRSRRCWDQALQGNRLAHALKTTLSTEEIEMLRAFAATLPAEPADEL
ncbi:MAG: RNase P modulator RnpM [Anaerolineae bacterium]